MYHHLIIDDEYGKLLFTLMKPSISNITVSVVNGVWVLSVSRKSTNEVGMKTQCWINSKNNFFLFTNYTVTEMHCALNVCMSIGI